MKVSSIFVAFLENMNFTNCPPEFSDFPMAFFFQPRRGFGHSREVDERSGRRFWKLWENPRLVPRPATRHLCHKSWLSQRSFHQRIGNLYWSAYAWSQRQCSAFDHAQRWILSNTVKSQSPEFWMQSFNNLSCLNFWIMLKGDYVLSNTRIFSRQMTKFRVLNAVI